LPRYDRTTATGGATRVLDAAGVLAKAFAEYTIHTQATGQ
jgi:hypothetical protein